MTAPGADRLWERWSAASRAVEVGPETPLSIRLLSRAVSDLPINSLENRQRGVSKAASSSFQIHAAPM